MGTSKYSFNMISWLSHILPTLVWSALCESDTLRSLAPGPLWSPFCASVSLLASSLAEGMTQNSVRSLWSATELRIVRHVLTSSLESTSQAACFNTFQHLPLKWTWKHVKHVTGFPWIQHELRSQRARLGCIAFSTEVPGNFFSRGICGFWGHLDGPNRMTMDDPTIFSGFSHRALGNLWLEVADGLIEISSICLAGLPGLAQLAADDGWCFYVSMATSFCSVRVG